MTSDGLLQHWREILAWITALTAWAGIVKLWQRQTDTVKQLKKQAEALEKERVPERIRTLESDLSVLQEQHAACAKQQSDRYGETRESLHSLEQSMTRGFGQMEAAQARTQQKLDDLITFTKNGGTK